MNITTAFPNYPVNPVPSGDIARRESQQKELIAQPAATEAGARERGVDRQANTYTRPLPRQTSGGSNSTEAESSALGRDDDNAVNSNEAADETVVEERDESSNDERNTGERQQSAEESQEDEAEQEKVEELRARDREVRTHEQQHAAVGGQYASAPSYSFERGPDGKSYAVDGKVSIDISAVPNDPEATIQKMSVVRRAALAPAEPSASDRAAAAEASQKAAAARAELAKQSSEQQSASVSGANDTANDERQQRIGQFYQSAVSPREPAALELTA